MSNRTRPPAGPREGEPPADGLTPVPMPAGPTSLPPVEFDEEEITYPGIQVVREHDPLLADVLRSMNVLEDILRALRDISTSQKDAAARTAVLVEAEAERLQARAGMWAAARELLLDPWSKRVYWTIVLLISCGAVYQQCGLHPRDVEGLIPSVSWGSESFSPVGPEPLPVQPDM